MRATQMIIVLALAVSTVPVARAQELSPTPAAFPRIQSTSLRETAQRIHLRMMDVNRQRLTSYERILERLRHILERITAVADRYEARGVDASSVYEAVATANRAIDVAQSALREQASREYLLDGTTDASARDQLQGMREQLADDLGRVASHMKTALMKVREAVRVLRSIQNL